jgi:pimeloyl-ACP methyl ester carboxylesterase
VTRTSAGARTRDADPVTGTWRGCDGNVLAWEAFDGPGPLSVVFLHGGGQSRHSWRRAARALQARGFPCLAFDLRGHADSDWIADGDYRLSRFQADLDLVLDNWARPAVVVGASLGGIVALLSTGHGSPWVRGLVMVDTAPKLNAAEIERIIGFLGHGADAGFASPAAAAAHVQAFFTDSAVTTESIAKGLRPTGDGRWQWHWDVRVVSGERNSVAVAHEAELRECARRVRQPFLLVRAGASELVTEDAVDDLKSCAPQLEVVWLPGAHHMITGDDNLPFVDAAAPFLTRLRDGMSPSSSGTAP